MKTKITSLFLGVFLLTATGCVVDDGLVGPEGPPGPPGNANVFAFNFTFSFDRAIFNGVVASEQFDMPEITPLTLTSRGWTT